MNIVVLGGTGFIGPWVVRGPVAHGHDATVYHRGKRKADFPPTIRYISGNYRDIPRFGEDFRRLAPEVVLDMIPMTEQDALNVMGSPVRQSRYPYRGKKMPSSLEWDFENYEKILVEKAFLSDPELPATIVRLPMVYGPGDLWHRVGAYLKQMDEGPEIRMEESCARWRGPLGYVEDVGAGVALAVMNERAAGRIYNIAEPGVRPDGRAD